MGEWLPWVWTTAVLYLLLFLLAIIFRKPGSGSRSSSFVQLLPVLSLSAETDGSDASVTLKWTRPTRNWPEVNGYEIRYKKLSAVYNSSFKIRTIPRHCGSFTLTQDDGLEPLNKYLFEIRPTSGHGKHFAEWTSTVVFISEYTT